MSLIFEGRISCFEPVTYLDRTGVTQIRPLLYISEQSVSNFAQRVSLPVVENPCPADKHTKRQEIKELIRQLKKRNPFVEANIMKSVENVNLDACLGYVSRGKRHHFLDEYSAD